MMSVLCNKGIFEWLFDGLREVQFDGIPLKKVNPYLPSSDHPKNNKFPNRK
jgi:hypothetical protein